MEVAKVKFPPEVTVRSSPLLFCNTRPGDRAPRHLTTRSPATHAAPHCVADRGKRSRNTLRVPTPPPVPDPVPLVTVQVCPVGLRVDRHRICRMIGYQVAKVKLPFPLTAEVVTPIVPQNKTSDPGGIATRSPAAYGATHRVTNRRTRHRHTRHIRCTHRARSGAARHRAGLACRLRVYRHRIG